MANTILHKRSSTPNAVPTAAQLSPGELALNLADEKVFMENSSGTVVEISYRDARARAAISVSGDLSYDNSTGVISYTEPTMYADSDARAAISVTDSGGDGSLSYNSSTGVITYTGPSASEVRAHFTAGTGITITSGEIATTITQYTDSLARAAVSVTDSGGDGSLSYNSTTGVITYTGPSASEVRAHFSAGTGITITSGEIATTITQYTDSLARAAISVTDSGGDGSLSYNSSTGVITYTGPSASEVRAHFTGGTGVTITDGSVAIGQAVGTTDNVTFGNLTVNGTLTSDDITSTNISIAGNATITGNLTVQGTTVTIDSTTVALGDNIIVLNKGEAGTPSMNAGLEIERGTSANVLFRWNETNDRWESTVDGTNYISLPNQALDTSSSPTFSTVTAALSGNASTASAWANARTITLGGDLTGSVSIDGSSNVTLTATVAANSVALGTDTTGDYVASMTAGTGITVGTATGEGSTPVITNTGVTSAVAGTGVSVSAATGAVTFSIGQAVATSSNVQFNSLGIGTAASTTTGQIRATNEITAYYSDMRLKENIAPIENALEKVLQLNGVTYTANALAESFGYTDKSEQVGLLAQQVKAVLPQVVVPAPFDIAVEDGKEVSKSGEDYLTVKYEKIVALLVEAVKDLNAKVESLEAQLQK